MSPDNGTPADDSPPTEPLGDELCLEDMQWVVRGALGVAGPLLSAGERLLARRLLELEGPPGRLWARLATRRGEVFRAEDIDYLGVPDVDAALDALIARDLAHEGLPARLRAETLTVPELKEVCRELGLPRGGRRADLLERVAAQPGWRRGRVFRVAGKSLLRRLELLWFRDPWRDRSARILERLGQVRWVDYTPTGGGRPFSGRAAMGGYLRALAGEALEPEQALALIRVARPRPAHLRRLDPRRLRLRRLSEALRQLERDGEAERAAGLYAELLGLELRRPGPLVHRLSLALAAAGRPGEGAAVCAAWRDRVAPDMAPALERTGRRLSRAAGQTWIPAPPLRKPRTRTLKLPRGEGPGARPLWGAGEEHVEQAVARALLPREAVHGENLIWTTLFGLCFLDLYWLPVPDMLPVPYLAGPLDLGRPDFYEARAEAMEARLSALRAGEGAALVEAHHARWQGARVAGVDWSLAPLPLLLRVVEGMGGEGLVALLGRLAREGWSAARGLPDLVLPPGAPLQLADAHPARVGEGMLLIEVKGEGDSLRDEQRVWIDHLLGAGVPVEVWKVESA
ncbi:MAG: VRR-NUC domain-containing protein [Alphaproteobacteria bacterium]|nr:VRR-NUC domain-containing protein [Alphaproteobacteria bacterium]MCB9791594.1 VRR-NUC domain-containing protein [Alphaproteobacteria bacterium]